MRTLYSTQLSAHEPTVNHKSFVSRHSTPIFFILACIWTWTLIGAGIVLSVWNFVSEDAPIIFLLATIAPFGPAFAAVLLITGINRCAGLYQLLAGLNPRLIAPIWYIVALVAPPVAILVGALLPYGFTPFVTLQEIWPIIFTRYLPYTLTIALIGTGLAEEIGWRGFAQPRLQERFGPLIGTLMLSIGAAVWHLPNVIVGLGGFEVFVLQFLYTIIVAFLFTWAYNRTGGSVLIVALLHAALNTSNRLLSALVPLNDILQFQRLSYLIAILVVSIASIIIIIATRGQLGTRAR